MTKMIFMCLLMIGAIVAQPQIPKKLQKLIDDYAKDPTVTFGFNEAKSFFSSHPTLNFTENLQFSDIEIGIPVKQYSIRWDILDTSDDTVAIKTIIRPSQYWYLPISAHGRYIYAVDIAMKKGAWVACGLGAGISDLLQTVENTKPGSLKKNPILIQDGSRFYLHFPLKSAHNLLLLNHFQEDALQTAILNSKDSSDNSRVILKHQKNEYKKLKPYRDNFLKTHPGIDKLIEEPEVENE